MASTIFSGNDIKTLKSNIDLNGNAKILSGSTDPTSSATSAPIGSLYLNATNGNLYKKQDAGSTTNWVIVNGINVSSPTVQKFTSGSGTYTTAANALYIRVRMVGGGGGGGGATANNGVAGTASTFGTTLLSAGGGGLGKAAADIGGAGGTSSLGTGPIGTALTGGGGTGGQGTGNFLSGGGGGSSAFGGGGSGGSSTVAGSSGAANTGGGGGGAGGDSASTSGGGGGSGGFVDAIITSPLASYAYVVGPGGAGGSAGTKAGGNGGSGYIEVTEYYQ